MKIIIAIFLALTTLKSFAQVDRNQIDNSAIQTVNPVPYRLYPTQNVWTFLKLNTRTGQMWQVQFGMKKDQQLVTILSVQPLVAKENEVNDRFTLYPTQNIHTFILLDQLDGRTWQVQWSTNFDDRVVVPIE
jgi:hypothetical protein